MTIALVFGLGSFNYLLWQTVTFILQSQSTGAELKSA